MKRPLLALTMAGVLSLALTDRDARAADPTTADCLGATESSVKLRNEHKLRAERAQLLICASENCPADIRKDCAGRVEEVNTQIPTIIFQAKDGAGADLSAVKVTMDGEVLTERLEGTAISIDPGAHTFTFEAAGQPLVTKQFVIQEAQKDRREEIVFGAPAGSVSSAIQPATQPPTQPSRGLGTQRVLGLVAGGGGVAAIAVGSVFGILTGSAISQQKTDCPSSMTCPNPKAAASDHSTWTTDSAVSTAMFVVGGVLLAGGAVLFFLPRHPSEQVQTPPTAGLVVMPSVGPGGGAMVLRGDF
jgi:hypothetical protein